MSEPKINAIVLMVDDSEDDRFFFKAALAKASKGACLFTANDGEDALQYFSHAGRFSNPADSPLPDYMFLDLKMPRRDGFEVLEWIAAQPIASRFPIIVLSGSPEPADIARAKELGARDYIIKPLTADKLRTILSED